MHTLFPWTQEPETKNKKDEGCYISAGNPGDLRLIAFVYATDRQENARLISQAPFLLLALEELIAEHDARPLPQGTYAWPDTGGMILARQAVAQATGNAEPE